MGIETTVVERAVLCPVSMVKRDAVDEQISLAGRRVSARRARGLALIFEEYRLRMSLRRLVCHTYIFVAIYLAV